MHFHECDLTCLVAIKHQRELKGSGRESLMSRQWTMTPLSGESKFTGKAIVIRPYILYMYIILSKIIYQCLLTVTD